MLEVMVDWVVAQVRDWGYVGIFCMMAVESSFVPFPSEVALIPAGYLASKGELGAFASIGSGLAGSLVGAFLNYGLAVWLGRPALERLGRFVFLRPEQFRAAEQYFERHGEITTFVGRLVPGIRQLISVPAGIARMDVGRFGLYTGLGAGLWSTILVWIGYVAGENEELWRPLFREATLLLVGGACLLIAVYVYVHRRRTREASLPEA